VWLVPGVQAERIMLTGYWSSLGSASSLGEDVECCVGDEGVSLLVERDPWAGLVRSQAPAQRLGDEVEFRIIRWPFRVDTGVARGDQEAAEIPQTARLAPSPTEAPSCRWETVHMARRTRKRLIAGHCQSSHPGQERLL
jgi:hypothetical protein